MSNIEKIKLMERLKISYLKNRGDALAVSDEMNLPLDFVRKAVAKFKKREELDVRVLIADTIMQHVLLGHKSRVEHYKQMIRDIDREETVFFSRCCNFPASKHSDSFDGDHYRCNSCGAKTQAYPLYYEERQRWKHRALKELREEDAAIVEFGNKMGYTEQKEQVTFKNYQYFGQNINVPPQHGPGPNAVPIDPQLAMELSQMSPMDREKIRKAIEKKIMNQIDSKDSTIVENKPL